MACVSLLYTFATLLLKKCRMKKTMTKSKVIRFRQWTRKGYAMFSSLGKSVAIGNLKKEIAEVSLKKQPDRCILPTKHRMEMTDVKEEGVPDEKETDKILLLIIFEAMSLSRSCCVAGGELLFHHSYLMWAGRTCNVRSFRPFCVIK